MELFDVYHLASPLIYWALIKFVTTFVPPCPKSPLFQKFRSFHNICMTVCSYVIIGLSLPPMLNRMDFTQSIGTILDDLVCKPVIQDVWAWRIGTVFLFTRWWELVDSILIVLGGKKISSLHWNHHASICFLAWSATRKLIFPNGLTYPTSFTLDGVVGAYSVSHVAAAYFFPSCLNGCAHALMYWWYFNPTPTSFLYRARKFITQFQIFQHITVFISLMYVNYQQFANSRCIDQNFFNITGLAMYSMYTCQFCAYYVRSYNKKKPKAV